MESQDIAITEDQIEDTFKGMMDNLEEGELKSKLNSKFARFKNAFNGKKIAYSLHNFIKPELDFKTTELRGIGRVSEQVPRFGGYYNKQLSQIGQDKIEILYNLIQNLMLRAYLTGVLMLSEELKEATVTNIHELFEKWIPNIYVTPFNALGSSLQKALLALCSSSVDNIINFLETNKIKRKSLLRRDKIDGIISYYIVAGCGLRITETEKHTAV
jgi:hypothetical protein